MKTSICLLCVREALPNCVSPGSQVFISAMGEGHREGRGWKDKHWKVSCDHFKHVSCAHVLMIVLHFLSNPPDRKQGKAEVRWHHFHLPLEPTTYQKAVA